MSLINLLTVGNSFSSIEDHPSRFKMRRENLLPHFGEADSAEAARDSSGSILHPAGPCSAGSRPLVDQELCRLEAHSGAAPLSGSPGSAEARPSVTCAYPAGRWSLRQALNPPRQTGVRTEAVPVQRDLPWEDIPVARNDLSEADLEVVPAPRKPEGSGASAPLRTSPAPDGSLLGRMKSHWFRGARK
jgi:hypothetical protein